LRLDLPTLTFEPPAQVDKLLLQQPSGCFRVRRACGIVVGHPSKDTFSRPAESLNALVEREFQKIFNGLAWP
jgi:hypothetical protein